MTDPATASLRERPQNYSLNINGWRGVSVLLVFLHHVANSGLPPVADPDSPVQNTLHELFMSFGYGVELFFMISGYVIVNSLRRHPSVAGFLRDRVLRIFPVWLPICLCICVVSIAVGRSGFEANALGGWLLGSLANLGLLPPLVRLPMAHPASWSLTYEWIFYLVSALAALLWRGQAPWFAKLLWGVGVALLIACFPRALFFLVGVWVALAPESIRMLQRVPRLAYLSLPVFTLTWLSTGIFAAQYSTPLWTVLAEGHGPAVLVAFAAGLHLFACVAAPDSAGLRVLRTRAAQHLGTISYSFYLVHPLAMAAVKFALLKLMPDGHGTWTATVLFMLGSALVAWPLSYLTWRWLEQGFGRWLKSKAGEKRVPAQAGVVGQVRKA